jgi:hypothetical protein
VVALVVKGGGVTVSGGLTGCARVSSDGRIPSAARDGTQRSASPQIGPTWTTGAPASTAPPGLATTSRKTGALT